MIFFPSFTEWNFYKIPQCTTQKHTRGRFGGISWLYDYFEAMKSFVHWTQKSPLKKMRTKRLKNFSWARKMDRETWKYWQCRCIFRSLIRRSEGNCGALREIIIFNIWFFYELTFIRNNQLLDYAYKFVNFFHQK